MIGPRPPRGDSGFVLVGVIMFVLALTILGLSLFSLSTYETQFLGESHDDAQALHLARGGIERVKEVVGAPPYRLDNAQLNLPIAGVDYAVAMQRRNPTTWDSIGPVDWSGDTVRIRVRARAGRASRLLEAAFRPGESPNYYKRLFTISEDIAVSDSMLAANDAYQSVRLTGETWQNGAVFDSSWADQAFWTTRLPIKLTPVIPIPEVASYFTAKLPLAQSRSVDFSETPPELDLTQGPPHDVRYVTAPNPGVIPPQAASYSFYCPTPLRVQVKGYKVWLCPNGFRVNGTLLVDGQGIDPTLIVVGGPNLVEGFGDDDVGTWLFGGVRLSGGARLILVSNGRAKVETRQNPTSDSDGDGIAVYARRLFLLGPKNGAPSFPDMNLSFTSDMVGIIDDLFAAGALPNGSGAAAGTFTLMRGTWREP